MPFDYGLRLDDRQRIANARKKPIEANKNQAVDEAEGLILRSGSPQNVYLLPQRQNFRLERCPRPKQIGDRPNNEPDKISHPATASPDSRSTASQIEFATGTGTLIVKAAAASPSGMSQSQIASTRSATAAEGWMLLEKPSGTICSPPHLGGCSSSCESPVGCPDTTRKAPPCGKSRKKPPKPSATPHWLSAYLNVVRGFSSSPLLPLKHFARGSVASSKKPIRACACSSAG